MPPKKANIVKSGNAFSSKPDKKPATDAPAKPDGPPPLFPPGYKWPLSLLQERCQKLGWEKPVVDTKSHGSKGFSFTVTLKQYNKATSQNDSVRMEPHPPFLMPSAIEARHWGATYALYRFCNGIQINRVLPPGPREYWNTLADEHSKCLPHQKWMYESDPFAAKRKVEARQAKASKKQEDASTPASKSDHKSTGAPISTHYPEVIMATSLRDLVEDAIKQSIALHPEDEEEIPMSISPNIIPEVSQQLEHLGFTKNQIRDATNFLLTSSPLASSLLQSTSPLQACIEYLILHVPECDLPERFLPSKNASNPFITSGRSGDQDIKTRWMEDKAVKDAGWPPPAVKEVLAAVNSPDRWDLVLVALGAKLIGKPVDLESTGEGPPYPLDPDEYEALGAELEEPGHLALPLFSAPIKVHILFSENDQYPRAGYLPIYITSSTAPAYVRLHLLSCLLLAMEETPTLDSGEGLCMTIMRILEDEWARIESDGPPDISQVLKNVVPPVERVVPTANAEDELALAKRGKKKFHGPGGQKKGDSAQIRQTFENLQKTDKYKNIQKARERLPAFKSKEDFLQKLDSSRVVVVVGETGCGKTTQLPQFILDAMITSDRGADTNILVTQPRRISAISVAARVSEERAEDGSVGYTIRGESKRTKDTRLTFCTTGVVLRRLSTGDNLDDVSHIVVDEVHERSMDGDFLLLELKELLKVHPRLKVVLMSATINHEAFIEYFNGAPLLTIPGFTHPVEDRYIEDIFSAIEYRPAPVRKGKVQEGNRSTTIPPHERIDYQLIAHLVNHIIDTAEIVGGVLIFLPGVNEIRQCIEAIRPSIKDPSAQVFPLHANLSNDEQRKVFKATKSWKIIAATNVAETSITIDDVIYVIDSGKVKETEFDSEMSLSLLVEKWVNRASARQRRGRAGRTRPGVCYKLYSRHQESKMAPFPVPEILRVPLESVSLSVKAAKEDINVQAFLSKAIDPPSVAAMDDAWTTLQELSAVDEAGNLTALGKYMSMLPVDVRLGKMLVLGAIFQCLGPITTVAALLSSKPLFNNPMDKRDEANSARARFLYGDSDLLTDVNAYDQCTQMREDGKGASAIRNFCEDNFISANVVREISMLRQEFMGSLAEIGLVPLDARPSSPYLNRSSDNVNLVKAVMLGGLWPRVARVHLPKENIKYDKVSGGTVQRENVATDYKMYDLKEGRVFLHPASILFGKANWKPPFLVYFHKHMTNKVYLRDATKVPMYAILLFGGPVSVDHIRGGLSVGTKSSLLRLSAIPRIGILINHLRRLLDAELNRSIEEGTMLTTEAGNPIVHVIMSLLTHDGRTESI